MFRLGTLRYVGTAASTSKVTIPPAIKRSPTELLEALASTVGPDPTAPHFAFIDDPATIPSTDRAKRDYYMAKEMGKRAARQLAEEWPTLFAFDRDTPRLDAFRPQKEDDPAHIDATEANLMRLVGKRRVKDAGLLYEKIRAEDKDVSQDAQRALFNLIVYYNGENVPFSEFEEWHGVRLFGAAESTNWTQGGLADLLFETLPQTTETKSTMVAGLCKHGGSEAVQRARKLMKEMLAEGEKPGVEAFNACIKCSETNEGKFWLEQMAKAKITPTEQTFNAYFLSSVLKVRKYSERVQQCERALGEMLSLKIAPTLTTYDLILRSLVEPKVAHHEKEHKEKERDLKEDEKRLVVAVTRLQEILTRLEAVDSIELKSTDDAHFFLTAMQLCQDAGNLEMADRLIAVYTDKKNAVKMPAFTLESMFYQRYLYLYIATVRDIEAIEKKYKSLVPKYVGVTRGLVMRMAALLKASPRWSLTRRIVEDGLAARAMPDHKCSFAIREMMLNIDYQELSPGEREEYAALVKRLVDIWIEFSRFTEEYTRRHQIKLSPSAIADGALLLTRIGENARALSLLGNLLDEEAMTGETATVAATGYARQTTLLEVFEYGLRVRDTDLASTAFEVLSAQLPRAKLSPLADRLIERCKLTPEQTRILQGFVRLRPQ